MERLAALAGVSRMTIAAVETGEACRDNTKRLIEAALDATTPVSLSDEVAGLRRDVAEVRELLRALLERLPPEPPAQPPV